MKPKSPCKGCEGHKNIEGCHSTCDAYLTYVEENKAFKEMVRKKSSRNMVAGIGFLTDSSRTAGIRCRSWCYDNTKSERKERE